MSEAVRPVFDLNAPVNPGSLVAFESGLPGLLPSDYRRFLLSGDGGIVTEDFNHVDGLAEDLSVYVLFGLRFPDLEVYELGYNRRLYRDRVPENFLVIGCDAAGNRWCIGLGGPQVGQVFWWDHEDEVDDGEIPTLDNMIHAADSFDDFVARIVPLP